MKKKSRFSKCYQILSSPQFAVAGVGLLTVEAASARVPLGLADPSMLPVWGSAIVLGVVAYRLKKQK